MKTPINGHHWTPEELREAQKELDRVYTERADMPQTKREHTLTPWDYGYKNDKYSKDELVLISAHKDIIECEEMQEVICGCFMQDDFKNEANARHIVHCVNSHDESLTLLNASRFLLYKHKEGYAEKNLIEDIDKFLLNAQKEG